ncbi:MAG: thiamine phosphate synthase [Chitinophagaceae bacterium]
MRTGSNILFPLYIITAPQWIANEAVYIASLLEAGEDTIHIRKPGSDREQVSMLIRQIPAQWHNRLVIHQHYELLQEYGLKGVHGNIEGAKSRSLHHWQELKTVPAGTDYVFISPVFDSISKAGYRANETLLQKPAAQWVFRLIALGGINAANIGRLINDGWDGAAVLGWIWNEPERSLAQYKELQKAITLLANET